MIDISLAAAAVRAAYSKGCYLLMPHRKHQLDGMACPGLTAALCAAADQIGPDGHDYSHGSIAELMWRGRREARQELLAIAAELER